VRVVGHTGEERNAVLPCGVVKPEGKRQLGRPRHRCEDGNKGKVTPKQAYVALRGLGG
jgi:hypothetical protein